MISIKKLLNTGPEAIESWLRAAQTLLRGVGDHAIRSDPEDYHHFKANMEFAAKSLADCATGAEAIQRAEAAIRTMEEYNRRTAASLRARGNELHSIVKMLTAAVGEISAAGDGSLVRLRQIEGQISSANHAGDLQAVKAQLCACVEEIRKESERQKQAVSAALESMQQELQKAQTSSSADLVTGLPLRAAAEDSLAKACLAQEPAFAAVLVVGRLQSVNMTFGAEAGDQLLRCFVTHMRQGLRKDDRLFRWTGAALLALMVRPDKSEAARDEIAALMEQKIEYTVRTATRSVRLPVTARWTVFPMAPSSRVLIQKIDAFAAAKPV